MNLNKEQQIKQEQLKKNVLQSKLYKNLDENTSSFFTKINKNKKREQLALHKKLQKSNPYFINQQYTNKISEPTFVLYV